MAVDIAVFGAFVLIVAILGLFLWQTLFSSEKYGYGKEKGEPAYSEQQTSGENAGRGGPTPSHRNSTDEAIAEYTKWLAIFTLFLVLSTIGLFISGERNVEVAREAAYAAKQSADGLMDAERPHMILSELEISGLRQPPDAAGQIKLTAKVTITNYGRSPAFYGRSPALLKSIANVIWVGTELTPTPQFSSPQPLRWIIAPGSWFGSTAKEQISIPTETATKIISGEEHVWGCIILNYEDPFKRPHETRSAYRVIFDTGNVSTRFLPDGPDLYWGYT